MEIRRAVLDDVEAIAGLFDQARDALKAAGIDQWQDGYPNEADARRDIKAGMGYVEILKEFYHDIAIENIYNGD